MVIAPISNQGPVVGPAGAGVLDGEGVNRQFGPARGPTGYSAATRSAFWEASDSGPGVSAFPAALGGSQRLLALLGLCDRALIRASVAGTLWPEFSKAHAYSSLRSAMRRLSRVTRDAVVVTPLICAWSQ